MPLTNVGTLGEWRWATADWMPTKESYNQANFLSGWGFYWAFVHMNVHEWVAVIVVLLLETCWQIVMGMVPDTEEDDVGTPNVNGVPYIGGRGFSYTNLVYAAGGMLIALLIDLIAPPHIRPMGKKDDPCLEFEDSQEDYDQCWAALEEMNDM